MNWSLIQDKAFLTECLFSGKKIRIIDVAHLILIHWIISFLLYLCVINTPNSLYLSRHYRHADDETHDWILYHHPLAMWYLCILHKCCTVHNEWSTKYPFMSRGCCSITYPPKTPLNSSPPGQNGRQFRRRHFQMHFQEGKVGNFGSNFTDVCS